MDQLVGEVLLLLLPWLLLLLLMVLRIVLIFIVVVDVVAVAGPAVGRSFPSLMEDFRQTRWLTMLPGLVTTW